MPLGVSTRKRVSHLNRLGGPFELSVVIRSVCLAGWWGWLVAGEKRGTEARSNRFRFGFDAMEFLFVSMEKIGRSVSDEMYKKKRKVGIKEELV